VPYKNFEEVQPQRSRRKGKNKGKQSLEKPLFYQRKTLSSRKAQESIPVWRLSAHMGKSTPSYGRHLGGVEEDFLPTLKYSYRGV
jgi:hypothetical protein